MQICTSFVRYLSFSIQMSSNQPYFEPISTHSKCTARFFGREKERERGCRHSLCIIYSFLIHYIMYMLTKITIHKIMVRYACKYLHVCAHIYLVLYTQRCACVGLSLCDVCVFSPECWKTSGQRKMLQMKIVYRNIAC